MHIQNAQPEHAGNSDRPRKEHSRRVAVLACHGMGQQVCYETVDSVATAICHQASPEKGWRVSEDPKVRVAQLGDQQLGRAEIRLFNGVTELEVHVYEAYWAPLTQGHICLTETVGFLFRSGLDGMKHWAAEKGSFAWRVFTDNRKDAPVQKEQVNWWVPLIFAMVLAGIGCLLFLGFAMLTFAVAWLLHVAGASDELCHGLATVVILLGAAASVVLAAVILSGLTAAIPPLFSLLVKYRTLAVLAVYVVAAAAFYFLPVNATDYYKAQFGHFREYIGEVLKSGGGVLCFAFSPVVVYGWTKLRYFMLEFIGDVAIYVSAYSLNRFWEVRKQIQELCCKTASAIYEKTEICEETDKDKRHTYDEIIVLGHSLGSVVAYHALNHVLVGDALRPQTQRLRAAERTSLFLTFGSPLDKITYLFRAQAAKPPKEAEYQYRWHENDRHPSQKPTEADLGDSNFRDALDGASAPLASCSWTRWQIPWTNIWAPGDIMSGALNYFDPAEKNRRLNDPPRVNNVKEDKASAWHPINAHTRYWTQPEFAAAIFDAIANGKVDWPQAPAADLTVRAAASGA